ncbi:Regulator of sigma-W protease RasP [bacterium HR34]|nr:Regulator of sigma-W protease RasP [bacterium HR34]
MDIINIIIALLSFIFLLVAHEFGHFYIAKKFGIKILEFGIGLPPRIIGKKIGDTIYSINAIPFGAFVKMLGEDPQDETKDSASFSQKPIYQRILVVLGGVLAFWILAFVLLSAQNFIGAIKVDNTDKVIPNSRIIIDDVLDNSPAKESGVKPFSEILYAKEDDKVYYFNNVKEFIEFVSKRPNKEFILAVKEPVGKEKEFIIKPRLLENEGRGIIGVQIIRTYFEKTPLHMAFIRGAQDTYYLTKSVIVGIYDLISKASKGENVQDYVAGPPKIFKLFTEYASSSLTEYLRFIAVIAISLAVINILPIPALDGGKIVFLIIEAIIGKPVNREWEAKITTFFFFLLLGLITWVSVKEIIEFVK